MEKTIARTGTSQYLEMMPTDEVLAWYNRFVQFSKDILKKDIDYGIIKGVSKKPSLFKPGAEKLKFVYGLGAEFEIVEKTEDVDKYFIDYTYKCTIKSKEGQILAQSEGNVNSYETKYRYLWKARPKPADDKMEEMKAEGVGRFRKINERWQWQERTQNKDIYSLKNTIIKMAQKRAFVGAMLLATGASEFYTQDLEDLNITDIDYEEVEDTPPKKDTPPQKTDGQKTTQKTTDGIEAGRIIAITEKLDKMTIEQDIKDFGNNYQEDIRKTKVFKDLISSKIKEIKKQPAKPFSEAKKEIIERLNEADTNNEVKKIGNSYKQYFEIKEFQELFVEKRKELKKEAFDQAGKEEIIKQVIEDAKSIEELKAIFNENTDISNNETLKKNYNNKLKELKQ
jgi:hypothetical protein